MWGLVTGYVSGRGSAWDDETEGQRGGSSARNYNASGRRGTRGDTGDAGTDTARAAVTARQLKFTSLDTNPSMLLVGPSGLGASVEPDPAAPLALALIEG